MARRLRDPIEQSAFNVVQVYLALVSRRLALAEKRIEKFEHSNATCRSPVVLELKKWLEVVSKLAATP